ncbi:MAG: exo-alpha-sialidase, partial [Chloroflexi bacterium]
MADAPDVIYLGGSFSYGQLHGVSNGRAVMLSTDAGATWSDLTQDADPTHAEGMHPDQHALVTIPGDALAFIAGSDGGVMRNEGGYADVSAKCDTRGLNAANTAFCKSLLSRVPNQLVDMNSGLNTLQFQSFSVSAQRPKNLLQGG